MKVKTILVSQPEPAIENSPYNQLVEKRKVAIDFRPFIHVEGVPAREVRKQKIDLSTFSAIILTSRNAVDHFLDMLKKCAIPFLLPSNTFANQRQSLTTCRNMWFIASEKFMSAHGLLQI